ncbi:MAG: hypothetical protein COA44_13795 [Arcobacter sp.]|nr:MAG: hypothetical protein COA44_13795 [Arcobacter sp.]
MKQFLSTPLTLDELPEFYKSLDFSEDTDSTQEYVAIVFEESFLSQNIVHKIYCNFIQEFIGFTMLRAADEDVDGVPGIMVEYLYLQKQYRGEEDKTTSKPYSWIILNYIVEKSIEVQNIIAVNHIYLVPVTNDVRKVYEKFGFENLPETGSSQNEDYMVFNLLEEDISIV